MKTLRALGSALTFVWALAITPLAGAQDITARLVACGACHGAAGQSTLPAIPSLAGQPRISLENKLVMIREDMREISVKKGQMDGVSDAEITALARHYAALPLAVAQPPRDARRYARGEQLATDARCGRCHLPTYLGRDQMPRLAGQREDYLGHSMREFAANQTLGRDTLMTAALHGLSDSDLQAIAYYLAHIAP